ncbi:multidrug ABC transporter ATP-binding protein [Streptomyces badius]
MAGRWRMSVIGIVMAAMPAVIYWAAGLTFASGAAAVSIGTLVAFVTLQQGLFRPAVSLLSTGVQMQTSLALFQRIFEYLDLTVDITEPENPVRLEKIRGEIAFEDVDFSYDEERRPTLTGIDVTVPAGGSLAVVGSTGSGKSTLSDLVPRLYDVTGGRVTLDGTDVRDLDFDTLAPGPSASSPRRRTSLPRLGRRQPALRQAGSHRRGDRGAARAAQIHDHIASLPDGYDTMVGERGYRFSGGEKQRLAIARADHVAAGARRNDVSVDEAVSAPTSVQERGRAPRPAIGARSRVGYNQLKDMPHRLDSTVHDADSSAAPPWTRRPPTPKLAQHEEQLPDGARAWPPDTHR